LNLPAFRFPSSSPVSLFPGRGGGEGERASNLEDVRFLEEIKKARFQGNRAFFSMGWTGRSFGGFLPADDFPGGPGLVRGEPALLGPFRFFGGGDLFRKLAFRVIAAGDEGAETPFAVDEGGSAFIAVFTRRLCFGFFPFGPAGSPDSPGCFAFRVV